MRIDQGAAGLHRPRDHRAEIERLGSELDLAQGDPGNVEQVVHQPGELGRLSLDHAAAPVHIGVLRFLEPQNVDRVAHGGQRIPELVRQQREKLVLPAVGLAQLFREIGLPGDRPLKLGRPLGHPLLQLAGQLLGFAALAIELREDSDFGAQQLGNDRYRDVIHGASLVALEPVGIGQVDRRDEDDSRLLIARVLPDDFSELEAVQLGHAHIDQHDGDVVLEQVLQRLASGARLDEVLAEVGENRLVAEQLARLVVHQQDVGSLVRDHAPGPRLAV